MLPGHQSDALAHAAALDPLKASVVLAELLQTCGRARMTVRGRCLAPAIDEGEVVVVVPAERRRPGWGDVVLVRLPVGLRLHRLVWPWPWPHRAALRTQADRSPFLDSAMRRDDILARVEFVERASGVSPVRDRWQALRSLLRAVTVRLGLRAVPAG